MAYNTNVVLENQADGYICETKDVKDLDKKLKLYLHHLTLQINNSTIYHLNIISSLSRALTLNDLVGFRLAGSMITASFLSSPMAYLILNQSATISNNELVVYVTDLITNQNHSVNIEAINSDNREEI